ncbi:MAG: DUF3300 domain-containing protein [Candidatus Acidiferrales bacterium]
MASVQRLVIVLIAALGLLASLGQPALAVAQQSQQPPPAKKLSPAEVDKLMAPIALYPDQLLVQILICSTSPFQVREVNEWIKKNQKLKGSALQEAAQKEGFDPSYIALTMFPQVVKMMAERLDWTKKLGEAFQSDREGVLQSAQRLRSQAMQVGNLKDTPQQDVSTQKTPDGTQVIVIQPANPEVIYVPQYNPQVVYAQPPPAQTQPTVVVVEDDDDNEAAAAAIGFTAGVIVGAWATPYWGYYPYGGAGYWYAEGWDDFYDHREDMWEDWQEGRTDRTESRQENRTERQGNRDQRQTDRQGDRGQRQTDRQGERDTRQTDRQGTRDQRQTDRQGSRTAERGPSNMDSRGYGQGSRQASRGGSSSGTRSGGFSGYGSGSSSRASSSRGRSSMGGSRGGGGRSRGGGGRRR